MTALPKPFFTKIHAATPEHYDGEERQRQIKKLQLGQSLPLVRNHDISGCNTAVKVCLPSGKVLGYLSAEDANGIAPLIDKGYEISALVKGKTGGINDEPAECIIEVLGVQMIEAGEERQTGLTEKQPPQKIFFPAGTKKTPAVTANETNILKSKRVESKLAMEIPPWERTEFAAIKALNQNPPPPLLGTGAKNTESASARGDLFLSVICKFAAAAVVGTLSLTFLYFAIIPPEPPALTEATQIAIATNSIKSEATRKEIFFEVGVIERAVIKESELKFPLPEQGDYSQERFKEQLMKQYEYQDFWTKIRISLLCTKYGIDDEQLVKISIEGVEKHWP